MTFSNTHYYQENEGAQEKQQQPNDVLPEKKFPRGTPQKRKLEALQPLLPRAVPPTTPVGSGPDRLCVSKVLHYEWKWEDQ